MDNADEIEINRGKILELFKRIEEARNQIRESEQELDNIVFQLKLSQKEHERSINSTKEILDTCIVDLANHMDFKDQYEEDEFNEIIEPIQKEIEKIKKIIEDEKEEFSKYEDKYEKQKVKLEALISNHQLNIDKFSIAIKRLSSINKELNDSQSIQVKVTLNYEENIILEELVKERGSNKSSVLRDMIKEFNNVIKERDSLKSASNKFLIDMKKRFEIIEQRKQSEMLLLKNEMNLVFSRETQELEKNILSLKNDLQILNKEKDQEVEIAQIEKEKEIKNAVYAIEKEKNELRIQLEKLKIETDILQKSTQEKYKSMLRERDITIEELRSMKNFLINGKKLKGKELESFCENEFNKLRSIAFPKASFEKQKTLDSSNKADLIFRDFDENGNQILSIIFELKEKKFDSRSLQKLDELRSESKCDYVLFRL